jgi:hypothetical protein
LFGDLSGCDYVGQIGERGDLRVWGFWDSLGRLMEAIAP